MNAQKQQPMSSLRFLLVPQIPAWKPGEKSWIQGYGDADRLRPNLGTSVDLQGEKRRFRSRESELAREKREALEAAERKRMRERKREKERPARQKKAKIKASGRIELG